MVFRSFGLLFADLYSDMERQEKNAFPPKINPDPPLPH